MVLVLVVLSLVLVWPFFQPGYFVTHDGQWAVIRLGAMHRALMDGHFPVRWAGNLNFAYGYPLFIFAYPLPYYLGEVFNLVGFGLVGAIKLLFVLSVFLSGLAMFFLAKEIFGRWGGVVASLFYLWAPFRLVDLYVRGSLGESLAFVLYPLLFLSLIKLKQNKLLWVGLGALFLAALILTHNVSALLMIPFLVAFAFLFVPSRLQRGWPVFALGLGLSAFFLYPALAHKSQIALARLPLTDKGEHFVSLIQLVKPSWGYGSPGGPDAFSFQLGWVHLVGLASAAFLWFRKKNRFVSFFLGSFLVSVLLMLPVSKLFWQLPLFSEIDFPWRLLGPASFFLALSIGYLGKQKKGVWPALVLVLLVNLTNLRYTQPSQQTDYPDTYYLTNEATTTSADELMPIWVKKKPSQRPESRAQVISGEGEINDPSFDNQQTSFEVDAQTEVTVQLSTIYFPGWRALVDGQVVEIDKNNPAGLITFSVPAGQHQVLAKFAEKPSWLLADAVSLASLLVVSGLVIKNRKR